MKLNIESDGKIIKKVNIELSPLEFMMFRKVLNLAAVHTNLNEIDGLMASQMYQEIEEALKERQK